LNCLVPGYPFACVFLGQVAGPGSQVAPGVDGLSSSGARFPLRLPPPVRRIMHRPVQLVDEDPSCPAPCIFPLGQRRVSGLPRTPHPSAALATNLRVAPNLRSIRLCRERISELPRISRFSAVPLMKLRVAPVLRSAVSPRMSLRVAPNTASSGFAGDGSPSCLESRILRR